MYNTKNVFFWRVVSHSKFVVRGSVLRPAEPPLSSRWIFLTPKNSLKLWLMSVGLGKHASKHVFVLLLATRERPATHLQHNTKTCNTTQRPATQHKDLQHNTTTCNTTQRPATQHNDPQHNKTTCKIRERSLMLRNRLGRRIRHTLFCQ